MSRSKFTYISVYPKVNIRFQTGCMTWTAGNATAMTHYKIVITENVGYYKPTKVSEHCWLQLSQLALENVWCLWAKIRDGNFKLVTACQITRLIQHTSPTPFIPRRKKVSVLENVLPRRPIPVSCSSCQFSKKMSLNLPTLSFQLISFQVLGNSARRHERIVFGFSVQGATGRTPSIAHDRYSLLLRNRSPWLHYPLLGWVITMESQNKHLRCFVPAMFDKRVCHFLGFLVWIGLWHW